MENNWVTRKKIFSRLWFFLIALFLIVVLLFSVGSYFIKSSIAAPSEKNEEKIFVIKEGQSLVDIAQRLQSEGLIKNVTVFRLYSRFSCQGVNIYNPLTFLKPYPQKDCLAGNIQAGSFKLSPNMSLPTLAEKLTKGRLDSWTKILEGWRNEEIATVLTKNYPIKEEEFLKIAEIGYMYPDTYLFNVNSTAEQVVVKLKATFAAKFTPDLQQKALAQGLKLNEVVTLASIIERETGNNDIERATIAGILLKRLRQGWKLEVDATVQFALGYDENEKTWWKKGLTEQDLQINSPYNTRRFAGLPPGPISNPSISSLRAVALPVDSEYYFYLHDKNGKIYYARTLAEHNDNKSKYLQ